MGCTSLLFTLPSHVFLALDVHTAASLLCPSQMELGALKMFSFHLVLPCPSLSLLGRLWKLRLVVSS